MVWTNLCRIYRGSLTKDHSLKLSRTNEDIYGEDKFCRIAPSDNVLLEVPDVGELGLVDTPVSLWFPRGVDIKVGYMIHVKKRKIIWGALDCVNTELSANATLNATTLYVEDPTNIESGDIAKLDDGTNTQIISIKLVENNSITLYADSKLTHAFSQGDTFEVGAFYKIMAVVVPNGLGPFIKCEGRQIAHYGD